MPDETSATSIGQKFGHYRITKPLRRGGMGDVYLAEDTRLGRKVALKFLPASLAADSTQVRRFEQEALAASALNHPNIVTVYEFTRDQGRPFLVTEFVEGHTLREVLHQPTFSLEDALRIAEQTALALSAAHRAGIVHRDVKPENIMLREDGIVKVLDFGLAKLATPLPFADADPAQTSADSDLETRHVTAPGSVLGTVLYMSPEQARGKEVDARTDVWSLGVVIYEMLAGLPPFVGETSSDVIAAILTSDPPPLVPRLGAIPDEVAHLVRKALQKDREARYQDIRNLASDLRDAQRHLHLPARRAGSARAKAWRRKRPILAAAAVAVAAALAGLGFLTAGRLGSVLEPAALRRPSAPITVTTVAITGDVREAAISPDGRLVAYVSRDGTRETAYVQQVAAGPAIAAVPPSETGWRSPVFSPDGTRLFLRTNQPTTSINDLYEVPLAGGRARKVITDVDSVVSFAPGGDRFVFRRNYPDRRESSIVVAHLDGAGERLLATRQLAEGFVNNPAWSPDGRTVASLALNPRAGDEQQRCLVVIDAADGTQKVLGEARWRWTRALAWLPDGRELLVTGKNQPLASFQVWRVGYPAGDVMNATRDAGDYSTVSVTADASALFTVRTTETSALFVAPLADPFAARRLTADTAAAFHGLDWTRDGRILYASDAGGRRSIWAANSDGSNPVRLTRDEFVNENPVQTLDGRYIVYQSERRGYANIWRMRADGSDPRQLTFGDTATSPSVTPDGRWVVYDAASVGLTRLFKVSIDGGTPEELTAASGHYPEVSPDGKAIAFLYYAGGTEPSTLAIVGTDGGTLRSLRVPADAWRWEPDGRALIYVDNARSRFMRLARDTGTSTPIATFSDGRIPVFDFSPDGKRVVFVRVTSRREVVTITGFR